MDIFESESSAVQPLISEAKQTIHTVNASLQTLPVTAERIADADKLLSVCSCDALHSLCSSLKHSCTVSKLETVNLILWLTCSLGFYLTGLFFHRLLQITPAQQLPKRNLCGLLKQNFLQAGYHYCHPTKRDEFDTVVLCSYYCIIFVLLQ